MVSWQLPRLVESSEPSPARAGLQRAAQAAGENGKSGHGLKIDVPLRWGRDTDIISELALRQQVRLYGEDSGLTRAVAPAMLGFRSGSAMQQEQAQVGEWLQAPVGARCSNGVATRHGPAGAAGP
jgi:hypothetical protein